MPIYDYECRHGHKHSELKKVEDRDTDACPECGEPASLVILSAAKLDVLHAGVDTGFPTLAAKWDKLQRDKNSGKKWDSNNNRFGGEYERRRG